MTSAPDWNPDAYARFRGLRQRPALDLLAQVGDLPAGDIIDLGCGDGAVGPALKLRFPQRPRLGVDASPAMREAAATTGAYDAIAAADIADWTPDAPPALIFSNAALQWLPDHATLMPRLAAMLPPGGMLAVQMPDQSHAPSHALLRQIAARLFPDRFDFAGWTPPVAAAADYLAWLAPLGAVDLWHTDYAQILPPETHGHPVRSFTRSTVMRPITEALTGAETARFLAAYDAALARAYPPAPDGNVLFPFRRLFFTLTVR